MIGNDDSLNESIKQSDVLISANVMALVVHLSHVSQIVEGFTETATCDTNY